MAFKHSLLVCLTMAVALVAAVPILGTIIERQQMAEVYDYIIIGGGTSGLTVANRLTENPDVTVLVLEAGKIDDLEDRYLIPRRIGEAGQGNTWPFTSLPNPELYNRTAPLTAAKVLGGGSAINGMEFDRGSAGDYDLWAEMIGDESWSFNNLLPYFKKSEIFTPPDEAFAEEMGITWDMEAHGTEGHIHSSFSPFMYETAKYFIQAAKELNLPVPKDSTNGEAIGAFYSPQSLHGTRRERSFARNTYHTDSEPRKNYHVIPQVQATKLTNEPTEDTAINFTGVEYVADNSTNYDATEKTIAKAKREIILAAGSANTPKLLQISGIGPKVHLEAVGVEALYDLPGVGENFQDHPWYSMAYRITKYKPSSILQDPIAPFTNPELAQQIEEMYRVNRTGPWCLSSPVVLGFFTWGHVGMNDELLEQYMAEDPAKYLHAGIDHKVLAGYKHQQDIILKSFREGKTAIIEAAINGGSGFEALGKPLSRGYIQIRDSNPLSTPVGDYRALTHPIDRDILVASVRWQQNVWPTAPALKDGLGAIPMSPSPDLTDEELLTTLRRGLGPSMYHLTGTCAMQKEEEGGCVDARLRVYGTNGKIRVVDASMMSIIPATHTQSTVYAVAEKASDMIKEDMK